MYGCIEGIGPELAATLHEAYPTVAELVAADREGLTDISGVGEKRARTVLAALGDRPIAD
jgi:predicted flap endonuclease-1-like 5' DNA nuclease